MFNWKTFSRNMRGLRREEKILPMILILVLYIAFTMIIAGSDIRKFKNSNGEVVYATIKSTATYSERHGTGRRRHTTVTQTADVEYTYNGETQTATVYKPFTKKIGDKIKLGITDDGNILVLHMQYDLTFLFIAAAYVVVIIVMQMKKNNEKEAAKKEQILFGDSLSNKTDPFKSNFTGNDFNNNRTGMSMYDMDTQDTKKSMLRADMQTAASISHHTNSNQYGNVKEEVDEVPKLKFELKKPLNNDNEPGQDD